jgi:hypothetical protein
MIRKLQSWEYVEKINSRYAKKVIVGEKNLGVYFHELHGKYLKEIFINDNRNNTFVQFEIDTEQEIIDFHYADTFLVHTLEELNIWVKGTE